MTAAATAAPVRRPIQPQIAVIDTNTNSVAKWVPIKAAGYGSAPTPDGHWLLMAMPQANEVAVVDLTTMTSTKSVPVCADPQEVLVRPDGKSAYVSCMSADRVAEIDLRSWQVTRTIATGKATDGLAWAAGQ